MFISENKGILKYWDYKKNQEEGLDPSKLTLGSNKKAYWKCPICGYEFHMVINKKNDHNCPCCNNKVYVKGINDLATKFPEIAKEWDYEENDKLGLDPHDTFCSLKKDAHWICSKCGKHFVQQIRSRTYEGRGCPDCAIKNRNKHRIEAYIKKDGSLSETDLMNEWDYEKNKNLDPTKLTKSSSIKAHWKCAKCGYEWEAKISNRTHGRKCPYCSGKVCIPGKNDLETLYPNIAKEWDYKKNYPIKPSEVMPHTAHKYYWICPNGHSYLANCLHRTQGTNCPICNSGRQTSFAEQALYFYIKKIYPDAINRYKDIFNNGMELDIFIPSINYAIEYDGVFWHNKKGSNDKEMRKYEICKANNITLIRVKEDLNIEKIPQADYTFYIGENLTHDELSKKIQQIIDKLDPTSDLFSVNNPFKATSDIRVDISKDETEIRKYMIVSKEKSLAYNYPELAKEWCYEKNGDLIPEQVPYQSSMSVYWKGAKCGHIWRTTIDKRIKGSGCIKCYDKQRSLIHVENKKIYQYSLDGKFIKEYRSLSEAARQVHLASCSPISTAAKKRRKTAAGYRWDYNKYDCLPPFEEEIKQLKIKKNNNQ